MGNIAGRIASVRSLFEKAHAIDDSESDTSTDFDDDSYAEISEDLKTDTTCLVELNAILISAARKPHEQVLVNNATTLERKPHQPYSQHISSRIHKVAGPLLSRLAEANLTRWLQCLERREESGDNNKGKVKAAPQAATFLVSKLHDSGIGSSVPNQSTYTETIMSYDAHGNAHPVRVPPLSAEAKKGIPFSCLACAKLVVFTRVSIWKRHLYADLCPWLCIDMSCPRGSDIFTRRDDWITHLANSHNMAPHWASFPCPLCDRDTGSGKISITRHLEAHLEKVSLAALPIGLDWGSCSDVKDNSGSLPILDKIALAKDNTERPVNFNYTHSYFDKLKVRSIRCK